MILSALPVADWRLLSSAFIFPKMFDLIKPIERLNERRIIFSTLRFEIEKTKNEILNFLIGKQ